MVKISPLAGKHPRAAALVDVPRLLSAYYSEVPDPAVPAQRVAFGTSGHRGSAFDCSFNEGHVLAVSQAICNYRRQRGIDGPLFLGMDTHALSEPAYTSALEVLAANGVTVMLETHDAFCRGQEVARVLAQVDSPRAQAIWDVHHPYRMGESVEDTWDFIGARLGHVHLKDARRRDDGGWDLVLMGQGEVPNRAVIDLLLANGYTGAFSAEWEKKWHPEIEEPEVALPQHAEVLRGWLANSR